MKEKTSSSYYLGVAGEGKAITVDFRNIANLKDCSIIDPEKEYQNLDSNVDTAI